MRDTETQEQEMETLHEVRDTAKVERIAKSIEENGWIGAPMVADGDQLITGVHRYAALRQLDLEHELAEHTIDIRDLVEDYDAKIEEMMTEDEMEWYEALVTIIGEMDTETAEQYGMDAD